jgi:hypothetical protein
MSSRGYKKPYRSYAWMQDKPLVRKPQRYCRSCPNKVIGTKTRCWECEDKEYRTRQKMQNNKERSP